MHHRPDPKPPAGSEYHRRVPVVPHQLPGSGEQGTLGLMLPTMPQDGPAPAAARLAAVAAGAERAGAAGIWACDHLFWHSPVVECLAALGVAATATRHCAIGSAVVQLPLRDTASVAKQAASLQELSGGRMVLGVGVGSHAGEYGAAGRDFATRGRRLDDQVGALHRLWRGEPAAGHAGGTDATRYRQLPEVERVPIWFAGTSPAAVDRTARLGDGWLPLFVAPDDYAASLGGIQARCDEAGRDPAAVFPAMVVFASVAAGAGAADRALERGTAWMSSLYRLPPRAFARHLLAGTARQCAERVARWFESGARHVVVYVTSDDPLAQFEDLVAASQDLVDTGRDRGLVPTRPLQATLVPPTALPSDGERTRPDPAIAPVARTPVDRTGSAARPRPSCSEAAGGSSR